MTQQQTLINEEMTIEEILRQAAAMLEVPVKELDEDLTTRLKNVNELGTRVGHPIRSTQVIAVVVEAWTRETDTPVRE